MKTLRLVLTVLVVIVLLPLVAQATNYTFTPSDPDIEGLDHNYYYGWRITSDGLATDLANGFTITSATLTFKNITNWDSATNVLNTYLFASPPKKPYQGDWITSDTLWKKYDGELSNTVTWRDDSGNTMTPTLVGSWHDTNGPNITTNLVYNFGILGLLDDLEFAAKDGSFGFGFDPDCHYYNDGVTLAIQTGTSSVPEPSSLLLLSLGLLGSVVGIRRRRA